MPSVMLSAVLEEEPDLYEAFPPHVDPTGITILTDSPPGIIMLCIYNLSFVYVIYASFWLTLTPA